MSRRRRRGAIPGLFIPFKKRRNPQPQHHHHSAKKVDDKLIGIIAVIVVGGALIGSLATHPLGTLIVLFVVGAVGMAVEAVTKK